MIDVNSTDSRVQRIWRTLILAAIVIGFWFLLIPNSEASIWVFSALGINSIACLGVSITNSYANIFSLGFGGIMLVAAYTCALLTLPGDYKASVSLPLWRESTGAVWFGTGDFGSRGGLSSIVLVLPAFRLRGHYFVLASMGINIVMTNLAINMRSYTHGPLGLRNIPFHTNVWWVYGLLALTVFLWRGSRSLNLAER